MKKNRTSPFWTMLFWSIIVSFIIFYPMLISIYVFLPLMIGFMGYVLVVGIDKSRVSFIVIGLIYLINLEANLSLPLFLSISAIILFYLMIYPHLFVLKKCKYCIPLLSVILIDLLYLILLLGYDYIFETSSIVIDQLLLYSLIVDIFMVFLL
ncbi:MAG TPA: hypothetical protein ENK77_03975 [Epsilonproteobacteria bacterium]|nr:hypothetical protein [Campylobacterota bacterium]HHH37756.1 hypothetical protein [Campylobacterota bacterium]